jgi:integrase
MKGCRPLKAGEIQAILSSFKGRYARRDRALVLLGIKSGLRISELLSLRVRDIVEHGKLVERVYVRRREVKKRTEGRTVLLHPAARKALSLWLRELWELDLVTPGTFVFRSGKGENRPITRIHAYRLMRIACAKTRLEGVVGTHSLRKTFAHRIYERLGGDLVKTQRALGHKSIFSTVQYLSFKEEEIDKAILSL